MHWLIKLEKTVRQVILMGSFFVEKKFFSIVGEKIAEKLTSVVCNEIFKFIVRDGTNGLFGI